MGAHAGDNAKVLVGFGRTPGPQNGALDAAIILKQAIQVVLTVSSKGSC